MATNQHLGEREDLYDVKVTLVGTDGKKCAFKFDTFDGGEVTARDVKYRPGNGTNDQKSLGGPSEVGNITVTALMTGAMYDWVPWMITQNGKATMYVNKQPLDQDGQPFKKPLAYKGKLVGVNPPKTSSESDAPGLLGLTQSSVTPITTG